MEPTKDNTSGTAEFDDFEDKDPDDCYCESFFQEASHKTKLNRDKNKIKDDLKYDKSTGVGEIHDPLSGMNVPIDISFDNKRPTGTGNLTYKNGKHAVGMNINPNDLNRGHGFTKYLHEKNHILQDLRKRNDGNDNNDLNMISAFISKHSNEIKTPHSSDKNEYLADLNVARTRGYDKTIRMLQDMMIKPLKSSPSAKNAKSFINKSADDKANRELSGKFLNELYEEYSRMLEDEKSLLNTMQASRNVGDHHYKSLEKRIKKMESDLSSKEHFMNTARQMTFVQEVNKRIDEHNSDLKLRILFLRDMKKVDSTNNDIKYKKEKSFTESSEPILSLLATINNRAYDNTSQLQNNIDEFIIEHFDVVDNMDFVNGMILSYVILDYVEDILHDEGDDTMNESYEPLLDNCYCESHSPYFGSIWGVMPRPRIFAEGYKPSTPSGYGPYHKGTVHKLNPTWPKVYHSSQKPLNIVDGYLTLNGPLYVSPYKSISSIFALRVNWDDSPELNRIPDREFMVNIGFKEWAIKDDSLVKNITEYIEYCDDKHGFEPFMVEKSGYVYEILVDDEVRDHIFASDKMIMNGREVCIDYLKKVKIAEVTPIKGTVTFESRKCSNQARCDERIQKLKEKGKIPVNESYVPLSEFDHFFQEAKLKSKARKELDDSDFALVYKDASGNKIRKYPINDEAHVKAAARMFPRGVPNKYRKEVAGKILRRAHKFGIDTEGWKSLNNAVKD